jgi:hypothetical protein
MTARQAHNLKVIGSNPITATNFLDWGFPVELVRDDAEMYDSYRSEMAPPTVRSPLIGAFCFILYPLILRLESTLLIVLVSLQRPNSTR